MCHAVLIKVLIRRNMKPPAILNALHR